MPVTINGLPLHPLVVHAAVVFTPVAGLMALAYLVPTWRAYLRRPLAVVAVLAALMVWLAASTGDSLKASSQVSSAISANAKIRDAIEHHEDLAGKLQVATWVLAALAVLTWWFHSRPGWVRAALLVLLPLGGIGALVLVVLTGDAGAHAVWGS